MISYHAVNSARGRALTLGSNTSLFLPSGTTTVLARSFL